MHNRRCDLPAPEEPMASRVPGVSYTVPAMPPPVPAIVLPSVSGLLVPSEPAHVHPVTCQLAQASILHGVPEPLGAPGQLPQLSSGVQLLPVAVACPSAYGWAQQVVMVPQQPMGLEPGALIQGEPQFPTNSFPPYIPYRSAPLTPPHPVAQHCVQGPPGLQPLPSSAQQLSEASNKDVATTKGSSSAASPSSSHRPAEAQQSLRQQSPPELPEPPQVSCPSVPRSGEEGGKKDKRSVRSGTPKTPETCWQENIPGKKQTAVCRVENHSKPLWDKTPTGGSGQQAGSSGQVGGGKRRASEDTNDPALAPKKARSPGDTGGQSVQCPPPDPSPGPRLVEKAQSVDPPETQPQDRQKTIQMPRTSLREHLLSSIQSIHPLGQRVKVAGPVRPPPDREPKAGPSLPPRVPRSLPVAPRPSVGPAASKPPAEGRRETAPAVARSSQERSGAAAEQPGRLSPLLTWGRIPLQEMSSPPDNFLLPRRYSYPRAQPTPLEEQEASVPITAQQRPERERMKQLAQEERQRAALRTSLGQLQYFVQREMDRKGAKMYGYP